MGENRSHVRRRDSWWDRRRRHGAARLRADVGIVDGRIVAIGTLDDDARQTIDAAGRVVSPGFVDVHTHYDAQLFWDPTCSPSPLHGVTTVVAGNCGITLAPVARDDEDFMTRLLSRGRGDPARVADARTDLRLEHVPRVPRRRRARAARDQRRLPRRPLRVASLRHGGGGIVRRRIGRTTLARMQALLGEAIAAGALGFSSSKSRTQLDGDGRPTPPNFAADDELVALVGDHAASTRARASSTSPSPRRTASTRRAATSR